MCLVIYRVTGPRHFGTGLRASADRSVPTHLCGGAVGPVSATVRDRVHGLFVRVGPVPHGRDKVRVRGCGTCLLMVVMIATACRLVTFFALICVRRPRQ